MFRVVSLDLSDEVFERGGTQLRRQWQPRKQTLLDELVKEPAVLRLSYLADLEDPELVEKAVGVDTTARLQTVWQVRVLQNPGTGTACATDDDDIPGWPALIRPSGARLTTSTGALPANLS